MSSVCIDQVYENKNFSNKKLISREYDNCIFINCTFWATDMSVVTFLECKFNTCKFDNVMLKETSFQDVIFIQSKLLGLDFGSCNDFLFDVTFDHCNLDYASFYDLTIKNTRFKRCSLKGADFTGTNLSGSIFDQSDLTDTIFERTIGDKVDFRTAKNFSINPQENSLKKAKFSALGLHGLLKNYDLIVE